MKTLKKLHAKVRSWAGGRPCRQPRSFRPGMELLEDRRVLSPVAGMPSAVTYGNNLYAFAREADGHLHLAYSLPGSGWNWRDQGAPATGVTVTGDPSAVTYGYTNGLYAFAQGSNGHLYVNYYNPGLGWGWQDQGAPAAGVTVVGTPSAVTYGYTNGLYAFAQGSNGHLYVNYYNPGLGWHWQDQGAPAAGATVAGTPSAIVYGPNNALHVFARGSDGHLYDNHYPPGSTWVWTDLSTPVPGVTVAGTPSAVSYGYNSGLYAFARGSNGHLYDAHYLPASGWGWVDHTAQAGGITVAGDPSAVVYGPNNALHIFVQGSDSHLYDDHAPPGATWVWTDHGTPVSGVAGVGTPSAVSYGYNSGLYAFVQGSDGDLYDRFYLPTSGYQWEAHGVLHPDAATAYSPVSGSLFGAGNPSYADVQQGQEGDCWLLAGLAETAARAPADIQSMFTYDGTVLENGSTVSVYTVRFYNSAGAARYVTVDTELPSGGTYYDQPVNNVLWAALAEKAYAEANAAGIVTSSNVGTNSYDALNSGDPAWALQAITGKPAGDYYYGSGDITTAWQNGQLVVLGTNATTTAINGVNIVTGHAYAVVGYDPSTQLFTLFNPWGVNGGYENVNGNLVFCAGTVTATGDQLAADFGYESFGSAAAPGGRQGHHARPSPALADLALIEDVLAAHAKDRRVSTAGL